MRIWMIFQCDCGDYSVVAMCDDEHLPAVLERCKNIPGMEVDLDCPIPLNATGVLSDAENAMKSPS